MNVSNFNLKDIDIAWCPGCGNFGIRKALIAALDELNLKPQNVVITSGIGQASKIPHYLKTNFFNGLHGRAIPLATGIKACNPDLSVIAEGGDGDMYGEGGNHFIHAIRKNPDITIIIHDNMVYGLTKGQAAPTTMPGMVTPVQVFGVFEEPVNPIALSISMNAAFVARAYAADTDETKEIFKKAILHKGLSIIDVYQPCVTFNKMNTFKWFRDHTYYLENDYNPYDRINAFKRALEEDHLPLGIFYIRKDQKTFTDHLQIYKKNNLPLYQRDRNIDEIAALMNNLYK